MNKEKKYLDLGKSLLSGPYLVWMTGFTIIPLLMILWYGLTGRDGAFTLENILSIAEPDHMKALVLSLGLSLISTLLCLFLAYPLAMILRGRGNKAGSFIVFIFILPMWMNFLLRTLAWQTLLEKNGVINGILSFFHLPGISIINTPAAIVLGMVYNFLPFMVLPIYNVLAKIDDSVIIHPLAMHMVQQYAKEGYQVAVNEFQFAPRYLGILDRIDYIKLNIQTTPELTLKNIICRLRPCNVFTDFPMLIARPTSYSFPSGHTSSSFAAALILTLRHKKVGWLAYIPAVLIAFSRIFLFVHYPTDVLAGILLGTLAALLTYFAAKAIQKRQAEKRTAQI